MNVVLVLADSLRMDALGCYGNPHARTPCIDALAGRGLCFDTCYSTSPLCVPARAQLLTGKHCHETGNLRNPAWQYHTTRPVEVDGVCLEPGAVTLPALLSQQDFYTAHLGKNHFYPRQNMMGFHHMEQCDFYGRHVHEMDDYYLFLKAKGYEHLFQDSFGRVGGPGGSVGILREEFGLVDRLCPYVSKLPAELQATPWLGERARAFLRRTPPSLPFFLVVSFYAPHDPYCVSEPHDQLIDPADIPLPPLPEDLQPSAMHRGEQTLRQVLPEDIWRRNIAHYLANVSLIDREVGGIVDVLKQEGRHEDTLLIVTSDHGDTLGEHGIWGKNLLYEDCARVPLIFHHGGDAIAAGRTSETATLLDLYPTILAQAGTALPPARLAGHALDLTGAHAERDSRVVFGELANSAHPQYFVRQDRWKLIRLEGCDLHELYDLDRDPNELHNLAHERPEKVAELDGLLSAWLESEAPFWMHPLPDVEIDWEHELRLSHL